jgi:hypothetical protein
MFLTKELYSITVLCIELDSHQKVLINMSKFYSFQNGFLACILV